MFPKLIVNICYVQYKYKSEENAFLLQILIHVTWRQASMEYRLGNSHQGLHKHNKQVLKLVTLTSGFTDEMFTENRFTLQRAKDEITCVY